jgi:hypothetical protein
MGAVWKLYAVPLLRAGNRRAESIRLHRPHTDLANPVQIAIVGAAGEPIGTPVSLRLIIETAGDPDGVAVPEPGMLALLMTAITALGAVCRARSPA